MDHRSHAAFRLHENLREPKNLVQCDRRLLARLRQIDQKMLKEKLSPWLTKGEIHALDARRAKIYVISAAGGKPRRLTSHSANAPSFSRNGKWVYFSSNRTGEYQIWKVPVAGGEAVQVTRNNGIVAFESADGAYVYYTQTASTNNCLRN